MGIESQRKIVEIMNQKFLEAQRRNTSYSLRAFARRLGIYPSTVSEILNGKRNITKKTGALILRNLFHDPAEAALLLGQLKNRNQTRARSGRSGPDSKISQLKTMQLTTDQYRLLSEWYCFAILSLVETVGFRSDEKWIARRLQIKIPEVRETLDRLQRMGLIVRDRQKKIKTTGHSLTTTTDVRDISLQRSHQQNLELAARALQEVPVELRDITAITMAVNLKRLPEAKAKIAQFRKDMDALLESGQQTEVYKLCIQLFPISHKIPEERNSE